MSSPEGRGVWRILLTMDSILLKSPQIHTLDCTEKETTRFFYFISSKREENIGNDKKLLHPQPIIKSSSSPLFRLKSLNFTQLRSFARRREHFRKYLVCACVCSKIILRFAFLRDSGTPTNSRLHCFFFAYRKCWD